jgi:hypothetical protein
MTLGDGISENTKAEYRYDANEATTHLQNQIGFDDKWRSLVEHTIYDLMKDAHQRGQINI